MIRLKDILKERNLTLSAFAEQVGISQSNLSNYVNGNISPTLETLEKIANSLNISLTELFKEKEALEFQIKYNGKVYAIDKDNLLEIIKQKEENGIR
ncbi:MAG: helix-turn-helix transcriptional regulator [Bacteroidales bacterium]|nr:helix-turn-helix transcriptional regulator [Bacteroidales bacterium]